MTTDTISPSSRQRPTVERTVFATPRAAEFLELRALQAQTGQPAEAFGHVVVKELLDNALDGAETAGRAPIIDIGTRTDDEVTFVTVSDNGAGITPAVVADLCDFNMLVSDKARYRGPARGAQGNALKTLLGIPYALDVAEPVIIESTGIRHELQVTVDRVGDVVVTHETTASDRAVGTSVTVPLPADLDIDAQRWAYGAALVNPHATITAIDHAYSDTDSDTGFYKPSGEVWSKWTPSTPSSPHWYDRAAFAALVHSHIREIGRTRCRCAARPVHHRVRRLVGQREAEGDPHGRRRCHPSVRSGRPRRRDHQVARRDARTRQAHPGAAVGDGRRRALPASSRCRVRGAAVLVQDRHPHRRRGAVDHRGRGRRHRQAGPHLVRVQPCAGVR